MHDHINLSVEIYNLLKDGRQLSISGITRELETRRLKEHRLIVTGYLRALKDLNQISEFDLSPSKIYMLKEGSGTLYPSPSFSSSSSSKPDSKDADIYACVRGKISKMTSPELRLETSVYILTTLFDRPCFESELIACGIDTGQLSRYFQLKNPPVFKSKDYKKYYDEIPQIPRNSPAYEIDGSKPDTEFFRHTIRILNAIIKDFVDVSELASKSGNTSLMDF